MAGGFIDYAHVDPSGIIRLVGWSKTRFEKHDAPAVSLDGEAVSYLRQFRFRRPDVGSRSNSLLSQTGLELNYLVPEQLIGRRLKLLTVKPQSGEVLQFEIDSTFINADYRSLLYSTEVLHRDHIYGSGPPNIQVHPHVAELAKELKGPVLDFGCGRGALMYELLDAGIEVRGLELDSAIIRQAIQADKSHLITLYDGSFPAPFADRSFESVVCSEVLEHIPDYGSALKEIARLAAGRALFTVPDASAIPIGFRHGSVPWHLMEATHVNFFNQESFEQALKPHFSQIEFGRLGPRSFNDSPYFVSLTALCLK